jgi:dienelactone hydrolase
MKKAKLIGISILGILFTCFNLTQAQNVFRTTTESVIAFYEYVPQDYNSNSNKYPVVIFLHGVGERGPNTTDIATLKANISLVAKHGPPKHIKNGVQFPFICITPQLKNNLTYWSSSYVFEVLNYVKTYLRIDERRIHITGLSMGGHATWNLCESFPGMWATGGPVCGFSNTPSKACNIAAENLPIWAFHGDADTTVPLEKSQRMVDAINACLPTPNPLAKLTIYPNVAHDAWNGAYSYDHSYQSPNYYEWLMTYTNKINAGNTIPISNAGSDKSVTLPGSVTLSGSGTDSDGSIASYKWTQFTGPSVATLTNTTSATLTASNLSVGTYTFGLQVKDNGGQTDTDYVKVTVISGTGNTPPIASAGADKVINLPATSTTLSGSATDSDGTIVSYSWTKYSGGAATLSGASTATLSLSGLAAGTYVFRLTATDNSGATHYDDVTVIVNNPPSANAGADRVITLPTNSITITGSGTDTDGTIASYTWSKVSGGAATLGSTSSSTLSVSGLVAGTYVFRLNVKDNLGGSDSNDMTLTVNANVAPVASAGADKVITLPVNSITLTGSATDADGTIASYLWTKTSGGNATLTGTTTIALSASALVAGSYTFRLTVTDNNGATHYDEVKVTVNVAPVVNAGVDMSIVLPTNSLSLQGTATDTDGTIASYAWTKIAGGTATLSGASTSLLSLSSLVEGTYTFRLTAIDNYGATVSDEVVVNVLSAVQGKPVNAPPVAYAGTDKVITFPDNTVSLTGSATDSDGTISTYAWTKVSGGAATMTNANTNKVSLSGLVAGAYIFRLTVTDNAGGTHYDDASVIVNVPPAANAGADQIMKLPAGTGTLTGSASDTDGTIASYAWSQVSGGTATLSGSNTPTLSLSSLALGNYVFRLTVTDNRGATGYDDVAVTVALNVAPSALAGPDREITLPTNSIVIPGSGQDSDGTITTYLWSKYSGGTATLSNTSSSTLNVSGLVAGTYVFRLRVIDNDGASDSNDMILTVLPNPNSAPTVTAGADQLIKLPTTTATIAATGSDVDGTIVAYSWSKRSGGSATLTNSLTNTLLLSGLAEGTYIFRVTVTDNAGATAYDDVTITVGPPNVAPSAHAGIDRSITLPTNSIVIAGSAEDPDGTIVSYIWSKFYGGAATLTGTNTPTLTVTGLVAGTYVFRLRVIDNDGASDSNDMILTVNSSGTSSARLAFDEGSTLSEDISSGEGEVGADDLLSYDQSSWQNKYVVLFDANGNRVHQGTWTREASEKLRERKGLLVYHIMREGMPVRRGKIYMTNLN